VLDQLSRQPVLWNGLRWLAEAGYHGERAAIARELTPFRDVGRRRFLDFGCGTGAFAGCFPAAHYVGVDISTIYLSYARRAHAGAFAASSGDAIGLRDASFDAGVVVGVIHHFDDALAHATFAELRRVLKPTATLLLMEDIPPPDRWNLPGHALHWVDRGGHIRDQAAYRRLFAGCFTVARSYPIRSGICDYQAYVLHPAPTT
jgi:SAM-dependent methyltransferase